MFVESVDTLLKKCAGLNIKYVSTRDGLFLPHTFIIIIRQKKRAIFTLLLLLRHHFVCACVCSKKVARAVCDENDHSIDGFSITFVFVLESSSFPATSPSA